MRLSISLALTAVLATIAGVNVRGSASVQDSDQNAIRDIIQRATRAFQEEDLPALLGLYSPTSPYVTERRRDAGAAFAGLSHITVSQPDIRRITIQGDRANARVHAVVDATLRSTGMRYSGSGPANLAVELVREGGVWRLWRERPGEIELVDAIVAAKTDEERIAIVVGDPLMRTPLLVRELNVRGFALSQRGRFAAARPLHVVAETIARDLNDLAGLSIAQCNIALTLWSQGDFASAKGYYDQCIPNAESSGSPFARAYAWTGLGEFRRERGELEEAAKALEKEILASREAGDRIELSVARNDLGLVYQDQGDFARAYETFETVRTEAERTGDKASQARALNNMGITHYFQGAWDLALDHYRRSLALFQQVGDRRQEASVINNIALVEMEQGSYSHAEDDFRAVLKIRRDMDAPVDSASVLNNIGDTYLYRLRYEEAATVYEQAIAVVPQNADYDVRASILANLSDTRYAQKRYVDALDLAKRSVAASDLEGTPSLMAKTRGLRGDAEWALGRLDAAQASYEQAAGMLDRARTMLAGAEMDRLRFLEGRSGIFVSLVRLLSARGDISHALEWSERAKARVLLETMAGGRLLSGVSLSVTEREKEANSHARLTHLTEQIRRVRASPDNNSTRLASLDKDLSQARVDYESTTTALAASHPETRMRRADIRPFLAAEADRLISDARMAILSFVVGKSETCLFVLRKAQPTSRVGQVDIRSYRIPISRKTLSDMVARFHQQVSDPNHAVREDSARIYQMLLAPAQAQLKGVESLIISPDGPLWELPFQALQSRPNRYLIEDYSIALVPSLTVYRELLRSKSGRKHPNGVLVLGNPTPSRLTSARARFAVRDAELAPLPDAEREARELGKLYGSRATVLIGPQALESSIKATSSHYGIVHLATHGIFNDRNPMYSYVVLAPSEIGASEDGLLEAWEMMDLKLDADLVVLSACDTGRGRAKSGEGLIGMSWALFVAGCPSTLVSQWEVRADSTCEMMVEFHRALIALRKNGNNGLAKARALRQSELKLLHSELYRHPFHWAGFNLIGDPG